MTTQLASQSTMPMLNRVISPIAAPAYRLENRRQLSWHFGSVKGESIWAWIAAAFTVYWVLFVAGAFLARKELNAVGGVLVLGMLSWLFLERLWVRLDAVVIACFAAAVGIPLLQVITSPYLFIIYRLTTI